MKEIAIIGFGFCGRLAFSHALQKLNSNDKILIFDKSGNKTLGPAFSGFSPYYILNVPASKMSAFSDRPKDFTEFLQKNYPKIWQEIGEDGFAPRQIYGEYLSKITEESFALARQKNIQFKLVADEVVSISPPDELGNFLIATENNDSYEANQVLLATSFKQSDLPKQSDNAHIIKKLWNDDAIPFHHRRFNDEKICLIGSGLTALDVIIGLKNKNFAGKIIVISRRGNFPKKHFAIVQQNPNFILAEDAKKGLLFLCLKIRNFLRVNPQFDLRHIIDSIRPITKNLWKNFDEKNKKLFLRFWPYWNIFRHRAPISSIEIIEEMIAAGQIEIKKKGVRNISERNHKILVETADEKIDCDYLINCLGFELRAEKYPLLQQMVLARLLKKDLLLAQSNHPRIHLFGGLNIGRDFECTAVPDLRVSVENFYE